jgi:hypothetical protein
MLVLACMAFGFATAEVSASHSAHKIPLVGVQLHSFWGDLNPTAASRHKELALAKTLHANVVRVDLSLDDAFHDGPDEVAEWWAAVYDDYFAYADRLGIKVLITVWHDQQRAPPEDMDAFAELVVKLVARYGQHLAGVEIWNEPNKISENWQGGDEHDYVRLLRAVYQRKQDIRVPILGGALAGVDASADRWVQAMVAAGRVMDGLSCHPYSDYQNAHWSWQWVQRTLKRMPASLPMWITEVHVPSGGAGGFQGSEAMQARWEGAALNALTHIRGAARVHAVFIYGLRDKDSSSGDQEGHFGVVRTDFSRKRAFNMLQKAFSKIRG